MMYHPAALPCLSMLPVQIDRCSVPLAWEETKTKANLGPRGRLTPGGPRPQLPHRGGRREGNSRQTPEGNSRGQHGTRAATRDNTSIISSVASSRAERFRALGLTYRRCATHATSYHFKKKTNRGPRPTPTGLDTHACTHS
jgi:hypothetical protein